MSKNERSSDKLTPLNIIRSETVMSRYPIHRLSKKGAREIEIRKSNEKGEITFRWEISYNSKYGQSGPLAYKVDTLVINRRIEEAGRPVPKLICLGSLKDISSQLGKAETRDTDTIKRALHQNASTYITAKLIYASKDNKERKFEFGGTRYNVVFTGEKLPDGTRADAVYIVLHDIYRELLNAAPVRPLDYDYLKYLPPAAQRFYELLSYQIFAALENGRPRAKYLYSDYCTYAPQTRYYDYEQVKKQMYKLHAPHREAGYIIKTEFKETTDDEGQPDWLVLYTPGPKAMAEHQAFTRRGAQPPLLPAPETALPAAPAAEPKKDRAKKKAAQHSDREGQALIASLKELHVSEEQARELVGEYRDSVKLQLDALPYRDRSGIRDLSAWLSRAIKENYEPPVGYFKERAKDAVKQKSRARKTVEEARTRHKERYKEEFFEYLAKELRKLKRTRYEAYAAFNEQFEQFRSFIRELHPESVEAMKFWEFEEFVRENPGLQIHTFWEWDEQLNPEKFQEIVVGD